MLARVQAAQLSGLKASTVSVEVDLKKTSGSRSFSLIGLPDKATEEARDRLIAAIGNSGYTPPISASYKVIVALAPADLKKEGSQFDLAIALSFLRAAEDVIFDTNKKLFLGELALDGTLRPVRGTLFLVAHAKREGYLEVYVPEANVREASLVRGITVFGVPSLRRLVEHLHQKNKGDAAMQLEPAAATVIEPSIRKGKIDLADIRGQESAKRGLLIAAAGRHNLLMSGPPGTGKSMLAKAFQGILPQLTYSEMLAVTGIHSAAGLLSGEVVTAPPLRAPHHSASHVAIVGGGAIIRPGDITLAHRGVLFLDELPEFDRRVIEALRQPLEDRVIDVARVSGRARMPANFILIATMNPCPCGNKGLAMKACICPPGVVQKYERKLSGPIMDRIDMWLDVPQICYEDLGSERTSGGETSDSACKKVEIARAIQKERFKSLDQITTNCEMGVRDIERFAPLTKTQRSLLNNAAQKLELSPRAYHRVIKLARTIADLEEKENIEDSSLLEALTYRPRINR